MSVFLTIFFVTALAGAGGLDELLGNRLLVVGRSNITPMITGVKSYKEPVVPPRLRALRWALLMLILVLIFAVLVWGLGQAT
jgi:hypothetical protein